MNNADAIIIGICAIGVAIDFGMKVFPVSA